MIDDLHCRRRLACDAALKAGLTVLTPVAFYAGYFGAASLTPFAPREVPLTWLDTHVPFDPRWVWAYASLWLTLPVFPWLIERREELLRYLRGLALLSACGFAIFVVYPVASPRTMVDTGYAAYDLLMAADTRLNAFPSLHAAMVVYSFLFGYRLLRDCLGRAARVTLGLVSVAWTCAILYATLATRQHYAVDLVAGALLGWIAQRYAWRGVPATLTARLLAVGTSQPAAARTEQRPQRR